MPVRTYKIRRYTNGYSAGGKAFVNYSLTVPPVVAEQMPKDIEFECVITDDGILYRPMHDAPPKVPDWAKNGGATKPAPRTRPGAKV